MADESKPVETKTTDPALTEFDGNDFVPAAEGAKTEDVGEKAEDVSGGVDGSEDADSLPDNTGDDADAGDVDGVKGEDAASDGEEKPADPAEDPEVKALEAALETQVVATPKPPKAVKAKAGDKDLEIPPDSVFQQNVDGKPVAVTMRQLLDSYASKESNHRQFRKLEAEKTEFETQKESFNGVINTFTERVKKGEAIPAVMDLVAASGADPLKTIQGIRKALTEQAKDYLALDESQRIALEREEEAEYLRVQNERLLSAQRTVGQQQQLERATQEAMKTFSIPSRDDFNESLEKVKAYAREQIALGKAPKDLVITPEQVGRYWQAERLKATTDEVLREEAPHVLEDEGAYNQLAAVIAEKKPTPEAIRQFVRKRYGKTNGVSSQKANGVTKAPEKPGRKKSRLEQAASVDPGLDINATPDVTNWRELLREQ